ncbi:MAG: hypothetical protein ACOYOH_28965, partial [Paracraurococcus sp.]
DMTINTHRFTAPPAARLDLLRRLAAPARPDAAFPQPRVAIPRGRLVTVALTIGAFVLGFGAGALVDLGIRFVLALTA